MDTVDASRQRAKDQQYLDACRAHGIEADLPVYSNPSRRTVDEAALDYLASHKASALDCPQSGGESFVFFDEAEEDTLPPTNATPEAQEAVLRLLQELVGHDVQTTARAIANRVTVLCWLLGLGPLGKLNETELSRKLGCTKALISWYAVRLSERFGLKSRQMKSECSRDTYRRAREAAIKAGYRSTRNPNWTPGDAQEKNAI